MSKEKNESERIFIQVSLSKEEKKIIKEFAKKRHTSASNIMREAIFDFIRRIKNPEMFNQTANLQLNPMVLEQMAKNTQKIIELQELTLEKMNVINEMKKTISIIKKFSIKSDINTRDTILNLFKAHKTLNPKEIIEKTNLDKEIVFSIVSELLNEDLIQLLTSNGRYKLK